MEGKDIEEFVKTIRNLEVALGDKRRMLPKEKRAKRKNTRRSPYATRPLTKGEIIKEKDFEFRRPGHGLTEEEFSQCVGMPLSKNIEMNEPLSF